MINMIIHVLIGDLKLNIQHQQALIPLLSSSLSSFLLLYPL